MTGDEAMGLPNGGGEPERLRLEVGPASARLQGHDVQLAGHGAEDAVFLRQRGRGDAGVNCR